MLKVIMAEQAHPSNPKEPAAARSDRELLSGQDPQQHRGTDLTPKLGLVVLAFLAGAAVAVIVMFMLMGG